jgi:signal transduction histidine kinase
MPRGALSYLFRLTGLFAAYVVTARLGLLMDAVGGFATLVWPPSGIALAALLIGGYRLWPAIALGALVVNAWVGAPLAVALGIAVGNTLEAYFGAYLLRRVAHFESGLDRLPDVFALVFTAFLTAAVAATSGVTSLALGHVVPWSEYGSTLTAWWVGDALGVLIVAALILTYFSRFPVPLKRSRFLMEVGVLLGLLVFLTLAVFGKIVPTDWRAVPHQSYLLFPVLIWAAVRFGPRGAALGTFVASVIAVACTTLGLGPFARPILSESLLLLQTFMCIVAITMLILGASISERKRAVEARDEFLAIASHELRTPVGALLLQVQSLLRHIKKEGPPDLTRVRAGLESADRQGQRLARLVNDLLDFSVVSTRKAKLEISEVDLGALVRESVAHFQDQQLSETPGVTVRVDQPGIGSWDRNRLERVVDNLLSNALKYGRGKPISVVVGGDSTWAVLTVSDRGIGIAKENHSRIFSRFERAVSGRNYGGFGLGLWIAREIVTAHGGTIRVESQLGEGATFTVELPRAIARSAHALDVNRLPG